MAKMTRESYEAKYGKIDVDRLAKTLAQPWRLLMNGEHTPCPGCSRTLYAPEGMDPLKHGCPFCEWGTE